VKPIGGGLLSAVAALLVDGEKPPLAGNAFEPVHPAVLELDAGPCDEVLDCV
jgi:hypothetical protein